MKTSAISALCMVGILAYYIPCISANAISINSQQSYSDEIQPKTEGLIRRCDLYIANSNNDLCINCSTIANGTMKTIGFVDIKIERSSDNKNWTKEKTLEDMLSTSTSSKYVNDYTTSVVGGYYYRVTLTHYAKESGLFGSSQSVSNTSNSVWIN